LVGGLLPTNALACAHEPPVRIVGLWTPMRAVPVESRAIRRKFPAHQQLRPCPGRSERGDRFSKTLFAFTPIYDSSAFATPTASGRFNSVKLFDKA
jgi:hypothetical protein